MNINKDICGNWFDSENNGTAISDTLLGEYTPSGKLLVTFPRSREQEPENGHQYNKMDSTMSYSDGIYGRYRYFDTKKIQPKFSFGYGLSYITFNFSDLKIEDHSKKNDQTVDVSFKITDTGSRSGAEVSMLYVHEENPKIERPNKESKEFTPVQLDPGESKIIHPILTHNTFKYCSPDKHNWVIDPNTFDLLVESSSADIYIKGRIKL